VLNRRGELLELMITTTEEIETRVIKTVGQEIDYIARVLSVRQK
jgi:hypothetical protein